MFGEGVEYFLGTAHREGGYQHVALFVASGADHLGQFLPGVVPGTVRPVAVGAFHHHQVRFLNGSGITQDGRVPVAQIAAEHQLALLTPFAQPQFNDCGAEDMAGVAQPDLHTGQQGLALVVIQGLEAVHGGLGILHRVQGLDGLQSFALALAVIPLGILFVDEAGVLEHDAAQVAGGAMGIDWPGEAGLDQQRQAAGVVQVGMGKDDGIQVLDVHRQRLGVAGFIFGAALDEAAFDQQALPTDFDQVTGAGDFAGGAEELNVQAASPRNV